MLLLLFYISSTPIMCGSWPLGGNEFLQTGWLRGSNLVNTLVVFVCIIVGRWAMFDCGCVDDIIQVSMVCGTGVLSLWYFPGFDEEGSGKSLGMGSGIVGVSSFLMNKRFHKGILPDPSTLTQYWWLGRVSMAWLFLTHPWVLGHCIATILSLLKGE